MVHLKNYLLMQLIHHLIFRSSRPEVLCKKNAGTRVGVVLKNAGTRVFLRILRNPL